MATTVIGGCFFPYPDSILEIDTQQEEELREAAMANRIEDHPTVCDGERARLFPVLSEGSKEGRAASIFLACLQAVPTFADTILGPIGRPIGKRSSVKCWTEVVFKSDDQIRPDGLLIIKTGKSVWNAILEFKVGGNLQTDQVEQYLRLAKDNKIDCLVTVSNDLVPHPSISPVRFDGRLTRSVSLYHFSWTYIVTQAEILLSENGFENSNHRYLVSEFARFIIHKSTGIKGYDAMPQDWKDVVQSIRVNDPFGKSDTRINNVIDGWIQEERELSLIMSKTTGRACSTRRRRGTDTDIVALRSGHIDQLSKTGCLATSIQVPDAAAPIDVKADLRSRAIAYEMKIRAPEDRKRATASINWLTRQFEKCEIPDLEVRAHWPGRTLATRATLEEIKSDPNTLLVNGNMILPHAFDVIWSRDIGAAFDSRKKFISELESGILEFYKHAGEKVISWQPPPPKKRESSAIEEIVEESTVAEVPLDVERDL